MPRYLVERTFPDGLPVDAITPVRVLDPYFHYA